MKVLSRFLCACFALLASQAIAGHLTVTLAPSQVVSAGAQWRVDGGGWRNSGATVRNLSNSTSHLVEFKSVSGWLTPAATTVTVTGSNTTSLTATYVQPAALTVTLTPAAGQWRIDGGAWRTSGTTATGLTPGAHNVEYSALAGYVAPVSETVTLISNQTTTVSRSYTQLAQVSVTLTPSTAQWRIDGGAWQNSGTTAANLAPGNHTIDYAPLDGYAAPASETVTLTPGQSLPLSRSYIQLAQLAVTLSPGTAQWRVDNGPWQSSGTTVANLAVGSHTIDYAPLAGHTTPVSETVMLASGQSLAFSRSYVQLAQLNVTLTPTAAQWRVDGGAWRTSGTTATDLAPGSHTIDYAPAAGYITPAPESINLTAGQSLSLTRAYVQLASLAITLSPADGEWRISGGAWQPSGAALANLTPGTYSVEYSILANPAWASPATESVALTAGQSLTLQRNYTPLNQVSITLVPATGTWRLNGGAWQPSGASLWVQSGSHAIEYAALEGYDAPPNDTFTTTLVTTRTYTSTKPTLRVHLLPSSGQWRVDGGAWQASGAQVNELAAGSHTIDYSDLGGDYNPLVSESVSLALRENLSLTRSYPQKPATVAVMLTPNSGQWRIYAAQTAPSGAWQNSGASVTGIDPGNYTVEYSSVPNHTPPPAENITLAPNQTLNLTRSHAPLPAQISVALEPATAQWRVDGGTWQPAGAALTGLAPGSHTLEFSSITAHLSPPAQTITLNAADSINYRFLYVPKGGGALSINVTPSQGRWRVAGGAWQESGATIANLAPGIHEVEFSTVPGYINRGPISVRIEDGQTYYTQWEHDRTFTNLQMTLNPSNGRYRLDGWGPHASGSTAAVDSGKPHLYTYEPLAGYYPPHSEIFRVNAPQSSVAFTRTYMTQPATFATVSVQLDQQHAQWRIYPGATPSGIWQNGSASVTNLAPGTYTIEYSAVSNHASPTAETVTLSAGQDLPLTRTYQKLPGSVTVATIPAGAQWGIAAVGSSNVTYYASGATATNLPPGSYTIHYGWQQDYRMPSPDTITVSSAQPYTKVRTYEHVYELKVSLDRYETGRWRIDGGNWLTSGTGIWNLASGQHTIEYGAVPGYVAPPTETITFTTGQQPLELYRFYQQLASVTVGLSPYETAQWRIDGGEWQPSYATVANVTFGVPHTIEYRDVDGYVTPPSETVTAYSGQNIQLYRSYVPLARVSVSLYPSDPTFKWRVDGGVWRASDEVALNLANNVSHTIEYAEAPGYVAPPTETFTPYSGQQVQLYRLYQPLARIIVEVPGSLPPQLQSSFQWRLNGGSWQTGQGTAANLPFGVQHVIDYRPITGYATPPPQSFTLYSGQQVNAQPHYVALGTHRLRFVIHPDLAGSLTPAEVQNRLAQYAAHITQIFTRDTVRVFAPFDPVNDVMISTYEPLTGSPTNLPNADFPLWVHAQLTDNPAVGTYGGTLGFESSGGGGLRNAQWDQIHDPATLVDNSPALAQYWRQLHLIVGGLERTFGAGRGDYASLARLHDASGISPTLTDVAAVDSATPDAFWNARFDFWTDPLTASAYANPRLGSPTSLTTLLNLVAFSPATRGLVNGLYRSEYNLWSSVPDNLQAVVVKVVNATTGAPLSGATLRVWNRTTSAAPNTTYEETVTSTSTPGVFTFSWTGPAFAETHNAKLLKASAPGYAPLAEWTTIYDAQEAKLIDGKVSFEVILRLTPQ